MRTLTLDAAAERLFSADRRGSMRWSDLSPAEQLPWMRRAWSDLCSAAALAPPAIAKASGEAGHD